MLGGWGVEVGAQTPYPKCDWNKGVADSHCASRDTSVLSLTSQPDCACTGGVTEFLMTGTINRSDDSGSSGMTFPECSLRCMLP